ncbi:MAG: nucleoside recognition domain-containing protein [Hyphomicrobiales bacterium]
MNKKLHKFPNYPQPMTDINKVKTLNSIIAVAKESNSRFGNSIHDDLVTTIYSEASSIATEVIRKTKPKAGDIDRKIDKIVTSRWLGIPLMILLLCLVFYITIAGANVPSQMIASFLFQVEAWLDQAFTYVGLPWWITGFFIHGIYKGLAWVISVMLPPMAIFFPMFTILEDLGYLPRISFNLDRVFRWSGGHGKQALTMGMGFGCNAAGIIATRIIDSPRERLLAVLTNNFVPCNGRWPLLIILATLFLGAEFSPGIASLLAVGSVTGVALFGIIITFLSNRLFSKTILKGEPSSFQLELPPYRRPQILRVLYTSLIDRTIFVLWRAIIMAAPAGGIIWLLGNIHAGDLSLMQHMANTIEPFARQFGMDGIILLAFFIAIPANEIVIPTIIMGYLSASQMLELDSMNELRGLFVNNGWTATTAICTMLFSLLHFPCSTTSLTILKETKSWKWTTLANLYPLALAFIVTFIVYHLINLFA